MEGTTPGSANSPGEIDIKTSYSWSYKNYIHLILLGPLLQLKASYIIMLKEKASELSC